MRNGALMIVLAVMASGCEKGKSAEEEAKTEAEDLAKKSGVPKAIKMMPPVPGEARVPCEQLIDLPTWQTALGETDPLEISDNTATDADAAAVCNILKGGKRLTNKEQEALAKKTNHKLGVIPGQPICTVTAFCWTVETAENFAKRCDQWSKDSKSGFRLDESTMGIQSCMRTLGVGSDDVNSFRFYDADTKCILNVAGGPANVDNEKIALCARTAADSIGPTQIAVDAPMPPAP